jgi:hypothetical protein
MSDALSTKARVFLRSVEHADEPTRDDFDRVRAGLKEHLAASIAAGVAVVVTAKTSDAAGVTATATTTAASVAGSAVPPASVAAGGAGALVAKLTATVLVISAVAGGTTAVVRHVLASDLEQSVAPPMRDSPRSSGSTRAQQQLPGAPMAAAPQPVQPTTALALAPTPEPAPSPALRRAIAGTESPPAPAAATVRATATATVPAPATATVPASAPATTNDPPHPSDLDAEIALLRDVRSALHAGDAASALSLLDQHDHLYPAGALGEDAAAERIYALCALGRASQAGALADRFLATHRSSPHAASVRASCGAN